MNKLILRYAMLSAAGIALCASPALAQRYTPGNGLPQIPEMPEIPAPRPENSVPMGNIDELETQMVDLEITPGPFAPTWESIAENYPGTPEWYRDAKFGIWVHFGPQSAGQCGDWYARRLYLQGHPQAEKHRELYGHPSEVGYKEVLRDWNPVNLDPDYLADLYERAGARYVLVQGVHHDNYDLWNSQYQPWNSVNIGPHRDILGEWAQACRKRGMRYGFAFHHEYTWWWWQTAFSCDSVGEKAGVPYDAFLTKADGKGKWWEGYDPRQLYGINLREYESVAAVADEWWSPPKPGYYKDHMDYCDWYVKQWALRMMDATANYDPDFIYTDGTVEGPFLGDGTGTGYKCNAMPLVMADYYNRRLQDHGEVDAFSIIKFRKPFNGSVNTAEHEFPDSINNEQPWMREGAVGDWFWGPDFIYDPMSVVRYIVEAISRDGNATINIAFRPDGSLDPECPAMLEAVGRWMRTNGQAVYGSRAWHKIGEGQTRSNGKLRKLPGGFLGRKHAEYPFTAQDIRFTVGKDESLYAFTMATPEPGQTIKIYSLGQGAENAPETITDVRLLGYDAPLAWTRTDQALEVTCPDQPIDLCAVFKINHD